MKKNKRVIIITIIAIIVIITGIIVGISINNHNTAVKEALSVSESKEYVYCLASLHSRCMLSSLSVCPLRLSGQMDGTCLYRLQDSQSHTHLPSCRRP